MERAMLAHPLILRLINADLDAPHGYGTKMSSRYHNVTVMQSQNYIIESANLRGALDDGVKHRLHVCRRTADDAEHLGGCRLMLQSLAQFGVAFLDFLEQPHVLDGDHPLPRKG